MGEKEGLVFRDLNGVGDFDGDVGKRDRLLGWSFFEHEELRSIYMVSDRVFSAFAPHSEVKSDLMDYDQADIVFVVSASPPVDASHRACADQGGLPIVFRHEGLHDGSPCGSCRKKLDIRIIAARGFLAICGKGGWNKVGRYLFEKDDHCAFRRSTWGVSCMLNALPAQSVPEGAQSVLFRLGQCLFVSVRYQEYFHGLSLRLSGVKAATTVSNGLKNVKSSKNRSPRKRGAVEGRGEGAQGLHHAQNAVSYLAIDERLWQALLKKQKTPSGRGRAGIFQEKVILAVRHCVRRYHLRHGSEMPGFYRRRW